MQKKRRPEDKYLNVERLIEQHPAKIYLIWSGRERGKSTNVLNYQIKRSYENELKFATIYRNEKRMADMLKYYNHKYNIQYLQKITDGEFDHFRAKSDNVYFSYYSKQNGKEVIGPIAGYYKFLGDQSDFKSLQFDDCYNISFEEFVTDDYYLVDEVYKFESLLSTMLRERQKDEETKVFLLGNTLSRVNPYLKEWGLLDVLDFQPNDAKEYIVQKENFKFNIYCWMMEDWDDDTLAMSKKGKNIAKGQWEEKQVPLLNDDFRNYRQLYYFLYAYCGFYFDFYLLKTKNNTYFLYCKKRTEKLENLENIRTIGRFKNLLSNYHTDDFTAITPNEKVVINLINQNKILFDNTATGTDFYNAFKQMKKDRLFT